MNKTAEAKRLSTREKIIATTIKLINESDGDITAISTRAIAERAGIGAGLINYHFQTKENLVEICVDQIIKNVVISFNPPMQEQTPAGRLKHITKIVIDFFMANQAIVRVSMLSDIKNPKVDDNTILSSKLISKALGDLGIAENDQFLLSFSLASITQTLFLRRAQCKELFGYEMNIKEQRDNLIDFLIDSIFSSYEKE